MKKTIYCLIFVLINTTFIFSQTVTNSNYHNNLYYLCKAWGYTKYFHSKIARDGGNWDSKLIHAIYLLKKTDGSNQQFNDILKDLFNQAGVMTQGTESLPQKDSELTFNLDTKWFDDSEISRENRNFLYDIKAKFRPTSNYYVLEGNSPNFRKDIAYYHDYRKSLPGEPIRLLTLFRYWNIINYYFPYKNIMDENWDSVLKEFIPLFVNADNWNKHFLNLRKLVSKIDDSHGTVWSMDYNPKASQVLLPITVAYIQNEFVVTGVLENNSVLQPGDIILEINGKNVKELCNKFSSEIAASNDGIVKAKFAYHMLWGTKGTVSIKIKNVTGTHIKTVNRNIVYEEYRNKVRFNVAGYPNRPAWKKINNNSQTYGYIDLGILEKTQIDQMFNDVWKTDGLIIDVRNYPKGTMWNMINWLFDSQVTNASVQRFDHTYPGTYNWFNNTIGSGDFSKTWDKPIAILFNEQTQSQAEFSVMAFELHPKAVKIGSQTSGADGNICVAYLPGGFKTILTGMGVFYPDRKTPTQRVGITPDFEVKPTIEGIRKGKDEVLEYAINFLNKEITSVEPENTGIPSKFRLNQNYPNPFNPSTRISYQIDKTENVKLLIFDINGRLVKELINKEEYVGKYTITWNGKNNSGEKVASGIYFCTLIAGDKQKSIKLNLLK